MNKIYKKFIIIIESIIVLAITLCFGIEFYFLKNNTYNKIAYEDNKSFYDNIGYNLDVSGASYAQIEKFGNSKYVDKISPLYQLNVKSKINNSSKYINIEVITSYENLDISTFTNNRLIKQINPSQNEFYCDYYFAQSNKLNLGDTISLSPNEESCEFKLTKIYRNDSSSSEGKIVFLMNDYLKKLLVNSSYTNVYIKCNDTNKFIEENLVNYKPLAIQKPREYFDSDELYNEYLIDFNSRNYDHYIKSPLENRNRLLTHYKNKLSSNKPNTIISTILLSVILTALSLGIYLFYKNKISKSVSDNGKKHMLSIFSIFYGTELILYLFLSFLTLLFIKINSIYYVTLSFVLNSNLLIIGIPLLLSVISMSYVFINLKTK